jgi:hypothetical protein
MGFPFLLPFTFLLLPSPDDDRHFLHPAGRFEEDGESAGAFADRGDRVVEDAALDVGFRFGEDGDIGPVGRGDREGSGAAVEVDGDDN